VACLGAYSSADRELHWPTNDGDPRKSQRRTRLNSNAVTSSRVWRSCPRRARIDGTGLGRVDTFVADTSGGPIDYVIAILRVQLKGIRHATSEIRAGASAFPPRQATELRGITHPVQSVTGRLSRRGDANGSMSSKAGAVVLHRCDRIGVIGPGSCIRVAHTAVSQHRNCRCVVWFFETASHLGPARWAFIDALGSAPGRQGPERDDEQQIVNPVDHLSGLA